MNQKINLKKFIKDGFISYDELLDKKKCEKIYNKVFNDRIWGKNLFQSEKDFLREFKSFFRPLSSSGIKISSAPAPIPECKAM